MRELLQSGDEGVGMQEPLNHSPNGMIKLFGSACAATEIQGLCTDVLAHLLGMEDSDCGFLYVGDGRFEEPVLAAQVPKDMRAPIDRQASTWLNAFGERDSGPDEPLAVRLDDLTSLPFQIHALVFNRRILGIYGVRANAQATDAWDATMRSGVLRILGHVIDRLADETSKQRRLNHLSAYARVSSMLGKSGDLSELLEIALYSSMEAVDGEAASVLLLDDPKENFHFYSVEGTAEPLLSGASFPAVEGFAGHVLSTMEAEIVNDVTSDARFYDQIDLASGFHTRNLIAVPLIAGDERIGVLEVLNRKDGGSFTPDDRLLLVSVADEMAYTIRNATAFDFLASQYCRRRQGDATCDACDRPIESWVPCARYRA